LIPYPCDYQNNASLRRARRGGNILVIVLCSIIVLLLGAGAFFALTNGQQGWNMLVDFAYRYCPEYANIDRSAEKAPVAEVTPSAVPAPKATPDPNVQQYVAQPFESTDFANIPDVVDAVNDGVVGILNYQTKLGKSEPVLVGSGSGFVYTTNGYIITNQHVIEGAAKLSVTTHDGKEYEAIVVGSDIMTDVALLKIDAEGLLALPIGNSDTARVGEFVLAIGDPISSDELSGSVTFGIVSALKRQINIEGFVNEYLQTDAAVNPGNSGGPLINMRGEVIGVTSAKYTSAGYDDYGQNISSEGIGFALPINNVMQIVQSLINEGSTVRPGIGVTIVTYTETTDEAKKPGVYIYGVSEGGPAEAAGLQVGDLLVALDGKEMTQDEFVEAIRAKNVGDTIVLTVERNGQTLDVTVTVGDMNQIHK
jgi:Trypsin-like serine proteases, typically periplasmic, contain C-terminal PDZ domain